ncbi:MobF family relaxase [Sporolituus thermophilus]|uniref:Conjugative relaxase domain-containing protein, TrwC/TraI family n=1 Tax=Sporolituus thermophilus DSM 23256 TaxID=1123285 RepID=A0A1G7K3D0_9FIRM|nr:MobF family relaxase [Sporolituus thermophilus]SDF31667.1 conjugative relaxase domain-containing protein, TrwC/TraI family [Sporolituus thermophilus DSM 23256]
MLSISNISANQAASYYDRDGYYARMDNTGGDQWQGKLKDELALPDNVKPEDFNKLVNERKERAGYDLTFSAPKSVSVAMCLGEEHRQNMIEAHHVAVQKTLELIEQREIGARVTKDGVTEHIKTGNMLCAKFDHFVNRNHDPQLHTHAVILNKTQYQGKWYAVDNSDLYKNKILYGQIYRNALAQELMKKGYEIAVTDPEKGFFELKGIDQRTIDEFSSRRQEILEKLKEWGTNTPEAAAKAVILTRKAKENRDMNVLMESWKETISELGGATLTKSFAPIVPGKEQQKEAFDQAVSRLSRKSFAFSERELKRAVLAAGVGSGMTEDQYAELLKAETGKNLVALGGRRDKEDGETYYTTRKNLEIEKEIFREVARTRNTMPGLTRQKASDILSQALAKDNASLSKQQRNAVLDITTTKDQYYAVQGLAGTGKTHMLNYARQVLENEGYTVLGACFTGKAASGLQEDAKIPSSTIHSFLNRLEREAGNQKLGEDMQNKTEWDLTGLKPGGRKEAWIIDEASMVDNNTMHYLMQAARAKGAKVVFVGDRQQLLPVGIGNAFSVLTETGKIGTVTLDEIRRQKNHELLQAVREAVQGDLAKALEILEKDMQVIAEHKDRMNAIVAEYTAMTPEKQKGTVILTAGNKDRRYLNEAIRAELKRQGQLSPGIEFKVQDASGKTFKREFAAGDKIIFLQNDNKLDVRNGQTGIVTKIDGTVLTVQSGSKTIAVDLEQYKKIDHGYAMTAHKAQGITTDRVLINLDSSQKHLNSRNAFYVDISRARHEVKVFTDNKEKVADQVREWAKKLTSDDFLITERAKPTLRKRLDTAMENTFKAIAKIRELSNKLPEPAIKIKNSLKLKF